MSDKFAIFRMAKLKQGRGAGSFIKAWRHLEKHQESAEISRPDLTEYNKYSVNPKIANKGISRQIRDTIAQHNKVSAKKFRSDAAIGAELLFSYSQDKGEPFNLEYIEQFEKQVKEFIKNEFPDFKPVAFARHCDESSVHWHVLGFCVDSEKKISVAKCLGGPQECKGHQTSFAKCVSFLGLKRGIPKETTHRQHTTKAQKQRQESLKALGDSVLGKSESEDFDR